MPPTSVEGREARANSASDERGWSSIRPLARLFRISADQSDLPMVYFGTHSHNWDLLVPSLRVSDLPPAKRIVPNYSS